MITKATLTTSYDSELIESTVTISNGDYLNQLSREIVSLKERGVIEALKLLGWTPPDKKPKIKMTKELPTEAGEHFFSCYGSFDNIQMVDVDSELGRFVGYVGDFSLGPVDVIGGYWAKVDKDQFEFEG